MCILTYIYLRTIFAALFDEAAALKKEEQKKKNEKSTKLSLRDGGRGAGGGDDGGSGRMKSFFERFCIRMIHCICMFYVCKLYV